MGRVWAAIDNGSSPSRSQYWTSFASNGADSSGNRNWNRSRRNSDDSSAKHPYAATRPAGSHWNSTTSHDRAASSPNLGGPILAETIPERRPWVTVPRARQAGRSAHARFAKTQICLFSGVIYDSPGAPGINRISLLSSASPRRRLSSSNLRSQSQLEYRRYRLFARKWRFRWPDSRRRGNRRVTSSDGWKPDVHLQEEMHARACAR